MYNTILLSLIRCMCICKYSVQSERPRRENPNMFAFIAGSSCDVVLWLWFTIFHSKSFVSENIPSEVR